MTRQLRPRKSQPKYTILAGTDSDEADENHAGPSSVPLRDLSDESDFNPENTLEVPDGNKKPEDNKDEDAEGEADDVEDGMDEDVDFIPPPALETKLPSKKSRGKAKEKPEVPAKTIVGPRASKRQNYVLPTPSVHHRHRAVPLYSRTGRVERLTAAPNLFGPPSLSPTNGCTESTKVSDRVNKAWGYNVGPGPLWDLSEDRGWYKEAISTGSDAESDGKRRPRVYTSVRVRSGWQILSEQDAAPYLPTADVTTEEGNLQPPSPIPCFFGPITGQSRVEISMFETFPMSRHISESKAHIFNPGGPVWALDWCPIHPEQRTERSYRQYLAIAPFPSQSHSPDIGRKVLRPSLSCIQIWSLSSAPKSPASKKSKPMPKGADTGQMKCEMVLCLDTGPAYELKWCPLPSHDAKVDKARPRKLGLLGGTFEDGSFAIFAIPEPSDVVPKGHDVSTPICVKLPQPILRIELEDTSCWTFDWANSEMIAIGTTNGCIAVYHIKNALSSAQDPDTPTITDLLPSYYLSIHQSAIRALAWIRSPPCWPSGAPRVDKDPTVIASSGYDGMECLTDVRQGHCSVMNRTRDVINGLVFSPFAGGPITMDHENMVKAYSASPSMLGRGHSLFEPQGPVWTVHASDFHPQLAVGAADGSCSTTNMLRSTRRGGSVPFLVHKIFQMDYNRNTKEFRMLDRFLPQESAEKNTATRQAKRKPKQGEPIHPSSTGAWPREVGVHCVVWNTGNGLASSGLLASGTASGLCRVDVLWGRWSKEKIPYGSVEDIRMEDGNAMEVDSEEEEEEEDS